MQDISMSFRIAVNANKEKIMEILKINKDIWKVSLRDEKIAIGGNTVVIGYNEDYDEKLSVVDEDGYLYYENNMDFYPQNDNLILEKQIQLAKDISKKFAGHGISLEIIAEFENLL